MDQDRTRSGHDLLTHINLQQKQPAKFPKSKGMIKVRHIQNRFEIKTGRWGRGEEGKKLGAGELTCEEVKSKRPKLELHI